MTVAEFEEKELEGPLNAQLSMGRALWTPGQVLEKLVGFDAAMLVHDVSFWAAVGISPMPGGLPILSSWWSGWPSVLLRPLFRFRTPPPFRLNAFLQYKRPEHLTGGREWKHWKQSYFRFAVTPHQQRALEECAKALGSNGLVAYGSPAFYQRADLFAHIEKQTLVGHTHFAPVTALTGHAVYSYVSATAKGKAHSEPVDVEPLAFGGDEPPGEVPPGDGGRSDPPPPEELLREAKRAARAAVAGSPSIVGSQALFEAAIARANATLDFLDPALRQYREAANAYAVAAIFSQMSGIQWFVAP